MNANLVYDGTNLTMTLTDTVTNATVTEVFPVNIPSVVGGNTAYVGFTGGTGGLAATQNVLSWTFTSSQAATSSSSTLLFTAPATIPTQQTVTLTATSVADPTQSASATVTLMPPAVVSVTPPSAILYSGGTVQFAASVIGASNAAVTWTTIPAGMGTIDATGLYTAPATITAQQTVTVTATSQADPSQSASATVTLSPTQCVSNGYSYERAITIGHTKIPNTDQANFPFLFNTTDPLLATTANGGHVASPNGYDIIFTSDPAGQNVLNHEMEEYNPVNGQVIAWVQVRLSRTHPTQFCMCFTGIPTSLRRSRTRPACGTPIMAESGTWEEVALFFRIQIQRPTVMPQR